MQTVTTESIDAILDRIPEKPYWLFVDPSSLDERKTFFDTVRLLIFLRSEFKKEGKFQSADTIRTELSLRGIELRDTPSGTQMVWWNHWGKTPRSAFREWIKKASEAK